MFLTAFYLIRFIHLNGDFLVMNKVLVVLFSSLFFSSLALANSQCQLLLSSAEGEHISSVMTRAGLLDEVIKGDLEFAQSYLKKLKDESSLLEERSRRTHELDRLIKENRKLRAAKGGYSKVLDARRAMKVIRLRNALRGGDSARVFDIVEDVMLKTEQISVELGLLQRQRVQLLTLRKSLNGFSNFIARTNMDNKISEIQRSIKTKIKIYHTNYTLYRAFRATFEWQIENGSDLEKESAEYIFSKVGLANSLELGDVSLLGLEENSRPSIDFMRAEYMAADFGDGTPRFLSGGVLKLKLENENLELRKLKFVKLRRVGLFNTVNLLAQRIRLSFGKSGSYIAKFFDFFVRDLQNQEALTSHFAELESIRLVRDSREFDRFLTVMTNYKESGVLRSYDFDFLTSFARASEYEALWQRMIYTLVLKPFRATSLVDKLDSLRSRIERRKLKLDLVKSQLETVEESNFATLRSQEAAHIKKIEELEGEISVVLKEIDIKFNSFLGLDINEASVVGRYPEIVEYRHYFDLMVKAKERAKTLGSLSVEFSPGSGGRLTAYAAVNIIVLRQLLIWTGGMDVLDAQSLYWFSTEIISLEDFISLLTLENAASAIKYGTDAVKDTTHDLVEKVKVGFDITGSK